MRAGKRNKRITIMKKGAVTRNALNEPIATWTALGTFWSARLTQKPTEGWKAGQTAAQVERAFNVRYTSRTASITPEMQLVCDNRTFEIISVVEHGREQGIDIVAIAPAEAPLEEGN